MRALFFDRSLQLRRDYPEPSPPDRESLVHISIAGICGTDLELARGYMDYRGVLGHEFVGRVAQSGNPDLKGKRVVGEINAGCGKCDACAAGLGRHCPHRTVLGILGRDGAFADYLALPDQNLLRLPESIPDEFAVLVEPVAAVLEILEQVPVARNESLLILGDGRLGAIAAAVLITNGFPVTVGGHHDDKLELIAELGAVAIHERAAKPGFDTVIDCTGSASGFRRAMELVRPRGRIVLKSTAADAESLNLAPLVINEVSVFGSRCGRFAPAIALLASGKLDLSRLISAVIPLDDAIDAMAAAARPSVFKVLLQVS